MKFSKVEICGVNTSSLKVMSQEEKKRLLSASKQGDMQARKQLIDGNLRLVLSIVQRFASRDENPDDLFQVGCVGLIKAIDNFNTELDVKFSTYAVPMNIPCGNAALTRDSIPPPCRRLSLSYQRSCVSPSDARAESYIPMRRLYPKAPHGASSFPPSFPHPQ